MVLEHCFSLPFRRAISDAMDAMLAEVIAGKYRLTSEATYERLYGMLFDQLDELGGLVFDKDHPINEPQCHDRIARIALLCAIAMVTGSLTSAPPETYRPERPPANT
jgi:hypothetical protein